MLSPRILTLLFTVGGLGLASAQSFNISSQCQSTLSSLVISSTYDCLNPQGLIGLFATGSNSSLVGPLNNWLTGLCSRPACSNETLATFVANLTSGCPTEAQSIGINASDTQAITTAIQAGYPTARQLVCLADSGNNNTLCVTELLTGIQDATGVSLSLNGIEAVFDQFSSGVLPKIPPSVLCNNCTKEAYNIIVKKYPDLNSADTNLNGTIAGFCGASFVDGSSPPSVSQTASNLTAAATNVTGNVDKPSAADRGLIFSTANALVMLLVIWVVHLGLFV